MSAAPPAIAQGPAPGTREVIVATTTSLNETGLLDTLAPLFEGATGYRMRVVAVGSGQALRMGERGDADVVLAHSPAAESTFMAAGHGIRRRHVASNYFTIVGPPEDPAGVRRASSAAAALRAIAAAGAVFVSRGDSSGTHHRELALWRSVGGRPSWGRYLETGQGMSLTLLVAHERGGYALTDRSSWSRLRHRIGLVPLRDGEPALRNDYSVIELRTEGRPRINAAGGTAFAEFMLSDTVQRLLLSYGRNTGGEPLFLPARR